MLDRQSRARVAEDTAERTSADTRAFVKAWLTAPLQTGAQLPSSRHLARTMAAAVDPQMPGTILELGPGTGVVTEALIERGVDPARLMLVEANTDFCGLLQRRYPGATVFWEDAYSAPRRLRRMSIGPVAAVVSSLPLLTQPPSRRQRLLLESLRLMAPGAPFIQFTYFYRSPIPLPPDRIAADVSPMIWRNLWPARVWQYRLPPRLLITIPRSEPQRSPE